MIQQSKETDPVKRKALVDQMQQLVYDQAPYHVLFYDAALHAYRTDKFGGWTLQPTEGGLPFFGYGARDYSLLTAPEPAATGALAPGAGLGGPGSSTAAGGVASPAPEPRAVERSEQRQHAAADRRGRCCSSSAVVVVLALRRRSERRARRNDRGRTAAPSRRRDRVGGPMGSRYLLRRIAPGDPARSSAIVLLNFVLFRMMPGSPDRSCCATRT